MQYCRVEYVLIALVMRPLEASDKCCVGLKEGASDGERDDYNNEDNAKYS